MEEQRALARYVPQIEDVLRLDRTEASLTIPAIQALWPVLDQADDASFVAKSALIYSLKTVKVKDEHGQLVPKWKMTPLARMEDGEYRWTGDTWPEYCLSHLQMSPGWASSHKRLWEVFHVKLGFSLEDLIRAGKSKLGHAVATVDRQYPDVDQRLIDVLFGNEHTCSLCRGFVAYDGEPPEDCPHCGQEFAYTNPGSFANTLAVLNEVTREEPPPGVFSFVANVECTWDDDEQVTEIRVLAEARLDEVECSLPVWEILVGEGDERVPKELAGEVFQYLRAKFGR